MAEEEEESEAPEAPGIPAWVMTFADLMSLLMCFFVLLLSFSQMDASKFKKVAGSMELAFGVQRQIVAYEIPKGTSVVAREFSPGKPQPTPLNQIRQMTIEELRQTLEFDEVRTEGAKKQKKEFQGTVENPSTDKQDEKKTPDNTAQQTAEELQKALEEEIASELIEIEANDQRVVIRILDQGSFESGEDILNYSFMPVLEKIKALLKRINGVINVSGHTDDKKIFTNRFRSNWELSAARAVSVTQALTENDGISEKRIHVSGFADTRPLFPNDSKENRQRNRRVEIIINQQDNPVLSSVDSSIEDEKNSSGNIIEVNSPD